MTIQEFEAEFGPLKAWTWTSEHQDIVHSVNDVRKYHGGPPLLRGRLTTWGWFNSDREETAQETDWSGRAEAWRLALELFHLADEAQLCRESESSVRYAPFAAHRDGVDGLEGLKVSLGIGPDELLESVRQAPELNETKRANSKGEALAYLLFWGEDMLDEGLQANYSETEIAAFRAISDLMCERLVSWQRLRCDTHDTQSDHYVCSPDYALGATGKGYLVGLWAYETRT